MGSLVSPRQYREFVLPHEQKLFAAVKEAGAIPRLHICGSTSHIVQGTPDEVAVAVRACAEAGGPRHFSAAGCEVPDGTPDANLLAHARALRELS